MIILALLAIENEDDRALLLKIYRELYPVMKARAESYVKEPHTAEDIVHDAVIRLVGKTDKLRQLNRYETATYVIKTVSSSAIDYLRKHKRQNEQLIDEEAGMIDLEDDSEPIHVHYERKEHFEKLGKTLQSLSAKDQELLYYKYFLDYSDKDIAKQLDMEHGAVRTALTRAQNRAKNLIAKVDKENGH